MSANFGKTFMILGACIFIAGLAIKLNLFPWLGRLPGDMVWRSRGVSFYFPIVTCILVSLALTFLMNFFRK